MHYVYILLCSDKTLYTGISNNIEKRFSKHQSGKGGAYTRSHKCVKIIYTEPHPSRSSALKREAQIKSWPKHKKIETFKLSLV